MGVRFPKNGEGEVACALAPLQDLVGQLGRRFLDVLLGDALYLQAPLVKEHEVARLGLVWAFTLKENQPELLHEAERCTQASPPEVQDEPGREIQYWDLPDLDWPVADRRVQVVKTVRLEQQRRVTVREKEGHRSKGKTAVAQSSTNFYATNFELGSISPLFIHRTRVAGRIPFISSVAAVGESIPKSFRPSPPTVTSSTPPSTKPPPWLVLTGAHHDPVTCLSARV